MLLLMALIVTIGYTRARNVPSENESIGQVSDQKTFELGGLIGTEGDPLTGIGGLPDLIGIGGMGGIAFGDGFVGIEPSGAIGSNLPPIGSGSTTGGKKGGSGFGNRGAGGAFPMPWISMMLPF